MKKVANSPIIEEQCGITKDCKLNACIYRLKVQFGYQWITCFACDLDAVHKKREAVLAKAGIKAEEIFHPKISVGHTSFGIGVFCEEEKNPVN